MSTSFRNHLALFGGSFNPPHRGHVAAIEGLLRNPGVNRVLVVPSFSTPLKNTAVPFEDRLEMARLAFAQVAEVSEIEGREKITWTWQLLECFRGEPSPVAFVIGTDQFAALRSWGRFPEVLGLADWLVLLRKPDGMAAAREPLATLVAEGLLAPGADPDEWRIRGGSRILRFVATEAPEISATGIRSARERGNPDWGVFVPESVRNYIERKNLYGT